MFCVRIFILQRHILLFSSSFIPGLNPLSSLPRAIRNPRPKSNPIAINSAEPRHKRIVEKDDIIYWERTGANLRLRIEDLTPDSDSIHHHYRTDEHYGLIWVIHHHAHSPARPGPARTVESTHRLPVWETLTKPDNIAPINIVTLGFDRCVCAIVLGS